MRKFARALLFLTAPAFADEVQFSTDAVVYDKNSGILSTVGEVKAKSDEGTIDSLRITYDTNTSEMKAPGVTKIDNKAMSVVSKDVAIETSNNDVTLGQTSVKFKENGSSARASSGETKGSEEITLRNVRYTSCKEGVEECARPSWSVWASSITNYPSEYKIEYWNAVLFAGQVPIFWFPYFFSYSPEVKNKSGLLYPRISTSSLLGTLYQQPVFFKLNPYNDLTITPIFALSKGDPWVSGEYRTNQDYFTSRLYGSYRDKDDLVPNSRWYLNEQLRVEFNDVWRANVSFAKTSDTTYLRTYERNSDPWLESIASVEGLWKKSYFTVSAQSFQDMRDKIEYMPIIAPSVNFNHISDVNRAGGYFETNLNHTQLVRDMVDGTEDPRYVRSTGIFKYHQPYQTPNGHLWETNLTTRGDLYSLRNINPEGADNSPSRGDVSGSLMWKYPLLARGLGGVSVIEPVAQIIASPKSKENPVIPNMDSSYMELQADNLFEENRFAGYDVFESGTRANYGLNFSKNYGGDGSLRFFIGQNYNIDVPDDAYMPYSGLMNGKGYSDVVSSGNWVPHPIFALNYKLRVGKEDWKVNSSDVGASVGPRQLRVSSNYMYLKSIWQEGNTYIPLHAVQNSVSSRFLDNWEVGYSDRYDIELQRELTRGAYLMYDDDCFQVIASLYDNMTSDLLYGGERAYSIVLNFKGIGQFGSNVSQSSTANYY